MSMPVRPWLTEGAHKVFALAHDLADELGHDDVKPMHFALSLVRVRLVAASALFNLGVPLDVLERELEEHLPPPGTPRTAAPEHSWTPSDERIIDHAKAVARDLGTQYYGDEHLFLAFLRDETGEIAQVLARHGVGYEDLRTEVMRILHSVPPQ